MLKPVAKGVIPAQAADLSNGLKYDYEQIAEADRRTVQGAAVEIKAHAERVKISMITVGQKLIKVKGLLPHGQFQDWCQTEFDMSDRMARNMMKAAEVFGSKTEIISVLSDTTMYLLSGDSVPESAREAVITLANTTGESPKVKEVKQIIEQHKDFDEKCYKLEVWLMGKGWYRSANLIGKGDVKFSWAEGNSEDHYEKLRMAEKHQRDLSAQPPKLEYETVSLFGQELPAPQSKRTLTLDETIAVIWRVLKHENPHTSDPNVRCTWLNKHSQIRDYEHALGEGVKLGFDTFGPAWATVANELRRAIDHEQRSKEKAAAQQVRPVEPPAIITPAESYAIATASDSLDLIGVLLAEVGCSPAGKRQLLIKLYELMLETFETYSEIADALPPNHVTQITLQGMIDKLKQIKDKS